MKERVLRSIRSAIRVTLILAIIDHAFIGSFSWARIGLYLLAAFAAAFLLKGWKADMPKRAKMLTVILTIVILWGAHFIFCGLVTRSDQILWHYSVSEDGSVITVERMDALPSSVGWVRCMKTEYDINSVYCYFYNTFGGSLSKLGAKYTFDIKLEENSTKIYFENGGGKSRLVLQKDEETNTWVTCDPW